MMKWTVQLKLTGNGLAERTMLTISLGTDKQFKDIVQRFAIRKYNFLYIIFQVRPRVLVYLYSNERETYLQLAATAFYCKIITLTFFKFGSKFPCLYFK